MPSNAPTPLMASARRSLRHALALLTLAGCTLVAHAQQVALAGVSSGRALLVIDGGAPKFLKVGQSHQGVRVLAVQASQVEIEVGGRRQTLRLGDAPAASAAGDGAGRRIVLTADTGGHFVTDATVNGRLLSVMVDTGATLLVLSRNHAEQLGLDYRKGQPMRAQTANGIVQGHLVRVDSVRIGDVTVYGVDAAVQPAPMPYALLGNSFLSRFRMQQEGGQMILEARY